MKRIISTLLFLTVFIGFSNGQVSKSKKAEKDTKEWRYEIECVGIGTQGSYLVKVWSYSKKSNVAIEQAKKNAVHAIVFKGFAGTGQVCPSQKALAPEANVEDQFKSFFDSFFADGGDYMKYVSISGDGSPGPGDLVKVGKEYKVGIIVSVSKDALRKNLEAAGIIKALNSGF